MPTLDQAPRFREDYRALSTKQREAFAIAVRELVEDLRRGELRKGLRIKRVQRVAGVWEMTWADDGRATFEYGDPVRAGHPHIIWRRVGGHDVLDNR